MLRIHFLNVGHGDCTFVEFPSGRKALIDINNSKQLDEETEKEFLEEAGLTDEQYAFVTEAFLKERVKFVDPIDPIEDYLKPQGLLENDLFRLIITHPDMDHITGLARLKQEKINIISDGEFKNSASKADWEAYQELKHSKKLPERLIINKGYDNRYYGKLEENWDKITILSPTPELAQLANQKQNWNLHSYVLLIEYAGHKIILGGDADKEVWDRLAESEADLLSNVTILKAPHHGRKKNFSRDAVKLMKPQWTVCSVGDKSKLKKSDGTTHDAHNNYSYYTEKSVLSTRFRGNIVVEISSYGAVTVKVSHNAEPDKEIYSLTSLKTV